MAKKRSGSLIQDQYPTRYLPHVGRQVMADGGAAAPSMNDLMATVNSVFSRSRPEAATRESLTGVSSSPYVTGPGAYTDAGGQKIAGAFVTGMKDGYPVPPVAPAPQQEAQPDPSSLFGLGKNREALLRGMGVPGYAGGGGRFAEMAADMVAKALEKARDVAPKNRLNVYHNVDASRINDLVNRFNGIPGPSLAISKPTANPSDFGNATLVGRPHMVMPSEDTHVFGADAYTPRMPKIFMPGAFSSPDLPQEGYILDSPGLFGKEVPATAENILAHMKQRPIIGGEDGVMGLGLLKAHVTPRPKTLEDIQRQRYNISDVHDEEDPRWMEAVDRLRMSGGLLSRYAREKSHYPQDQMLQGAIDFHNEGLPGLYRTYREDISPSGIASIKNLIHDTKQLQPSYMEAKPMRNVGFDEFGAAVLPDDGRGSVAHGALVRAGMPEQSIMYYKKPSERVGLLKELAKDYGFADGGSVDQAVSMLRARRRHANGGIEPGDRASEFVADQLYGDKIRELSRPSPLLEKYSDRMTDMAMWENADRPMPTAHEFVQHQLNKREPQLPQRDRVAEAQMRDLGKEAIHMGAYFTPAAPIAAAYDVYEGLRSGDPVDLAMAALGTRGRAAKSALAATGVMMPQKAEAVVPTSAAMRSGVTKFLPKLEAFEQAVKNTPGASIQNESLIMPLVRKQMAAQHGMPSVRGGVFYLPEGDRRLSHYSGSGYYGGQDKISGETAVLNPLFVKGATGGRAPEAAYASLMGKEAMKKLDKDVFSAVNDKYWMQKKDPELYSERIKNLLSDYGSDPTISDYLIENSNLGNQLRYALQENIIGSAARRAGHDAILGYSMGRGKRPFLSELFDVRESHYPTPEGGYRVFDRFLPRSDGGSVVKLAHDVISSERDAA